MCVPCLCMWGIILAGRHTPGGSSLGCEQNNIPLLLFMFITLEGRATVATTAVSPHLCHLTPPPCPPQVSQGTCPTPPVPPKQHPVRERKTQAKFKTGSLPPLSPPLPPPPSFGAAPPTQLPKHNRCLVCNSLQAFQSK